jgi:hypothetical protein
MHERFYFRLCRTMFRVWHRNRLALGFHEISSLAANLQVCPGIFAGKSQVMGARCAYAYYHPTLAEDNA